METERVKVNLKINGEVVPFLLNPEDEPFYRDAAIKINERLAVLQNIHGAVAKPEVLLTAVAVEALVDAIQANDSYERLKAEISNRLDGLS